MKTLNVTDQTYTDLYQNVVPIILKEHGENVSQDDIVRELIMVFLSKKVTK